MIVEEEKREITAVQMEHHEAEGATSTLLHHHGNHVRDIVIDLVAGSLGATTSVYIGQPLDTLKVKMQTFPTLYPNLGTCLKQTWRNEGVVRGLYAGTVPSLAANVAENSILFAAYGVCQKAVVNVLGESEGEWQNGLAGFLAAFFSSLALCPTELVKCRLQARREAMAGAKSPHVGPLRLTAEILRQDGLPGLFRGLSATFAREMPGYFCFFYAYEFTRGLFCKPGQTKDDIGPAATIFSGGVAGTVLWTAIFPADVIKSRQQVSTSKDSSGLVRFALQIYRTEGLMAFYSGLLPTVLRTFPATGGLFFAFEYSRKFMMQQWPV